MNGSVSINFGPNGDVTSVLVGQSVEAARELFADAYGIPSDAEARVNGAAASDDTTLEDGDKLAFVATTGSKG